MFCNKSKSVSKNVPGKQNKKRKKKSTHFQISDNKLRNTNQSHLNIAHAMTTWAHNYAAASTWQLKHQIAYWKSRAVALQYENNVLHEMIREQHFKLPATKPRNELVSDSSHSDEETEHEDEEGEGNIIEADEENDDIEVSEEFIEFLKQNAKYKEDARREREQLKAKLDADQHEAVTHEQETSEDKQSRFIDLYGDNWERVIALETSVLCTFINECDKVQPEYWPNIPFNFSSH